VPTPQQMIQMVLVFFIILGMPTEVRACTVLFLFINNFKVKEETFIPLN
jgi:hypothetical protein